MKHNQSDQDKPLPPGDVLGISETDPNVKIPVSGRRDHRPLAGIEVGDKATGIGDVPQRSGASGADLGGFEGADVTPEPVENPGEEDETPKKK